MSTNLPGGNDHDTRRAGEIPILQGPVTPEEKKAHEEEEHKKALEQADTAYKSRQLALTKSNVYLTWILAVFTAVGAIAAIYQGYTSRINARAAETAAKAAQDAVYVARQQAEIADRSSKESFDAARTSLNASIDEFHLENRAYLSADEPAEETLGGWGQIRVPISNTGHVSALRSHLRINFERLSSGMKILDDRVEDMRVQDQITPGARSYFLLITMPNLSSENYAEVGNGRQSLYVRGRLTYDSGFGIKDTLYLCFIFQNQRGRWVNCSGNGDSVWLNDAKRRDIEKLNKRLKH